MSTIGNRLKHARTVRGISQAALAQEIGSSRGVITNIERNIVTDPQSIVIKAICNTLQIHETWLMHGTGPIDNYSAPRNSNDVLREIHKQLLLMSENEQLFILDIVNSYKNRLGEK